MMTYGKVGDLPYLVAVPWLEIVVLADDSTPPYINANFGHGC